MSSRVTAGFAAGPLPVQSGHRSGVRHQAYASRAENFDLWVEGLRAAAHTARAKGNITLAEALDVTRFEVYEGYPDEELYH